MVAHKHIRSTSDQNNPSPSHSRRSDLGPDDEETTDSGESVHSEPPSDDDLEVTESTPTTHTISRSGRSVQKNPDPNIYQSSALTTEPVSTVDEEDSGQEAEEITLVKRKPKPPLPVRVEEVSTNAGEQTAPAGKKRKATDEQKGKAKFTSPRKSKRKAESSSTPASNPETSELADLKGWLTFDDKHSLDRLSIFHPKGVSPCARLDFSFLDRMGIGSRVRQLVKGIGWEVLFFSEHPTFSELSLEFYSTFWLASDQFKPNGNTGPCLSAPNVVNFRLMGKWSHLSVNELNCVIGAVSVDKLESSTYQSAHTVYPSDFDANTAFQELTGGKIAKFSPKFSKGHEISDPALRILHRFLAFTFSGKPNSSGQLSMQELFFLWCMKHEVRLNLGFWFATAVTNAQVISRSPVMGSLITCIAINRHNLVLPSSNLSAPLDFKMLDPKTLDGMGHLCVSQQRVLRFSAGLTPVKEQVFGTKHRGNITYPTAAQIKHPGQTSSVPDAPTHPGQHDPPRPPAAQDVHPALLAATAETNILLRSILRQLQDLTTKVARRNLPPF